MALQLVAVVRNQLNWVFQYRNCGEGLERRSWRDLAVGHHDTGENWANIGMGQIEHKRAARAGRAAQLDFAAEQVREFPADRQPKPGPAILAAGAGVGLLEGFKDDLLLFKRNSDARVGNLEGHHGRRSFEDRM